MKDKNLAVLIKYYKVGKVTEFTLCSEIEEYLSTTLRTQVEISKGTHNATYVVALLPIKTETGYKVKYIIDKAAIDSPYLTEEDIVDSLDCLKYAEQEILRALHKELSVLKYNEAGLSELLASYLRVFRIGQSALPVSVKEKVIKNKMMDPSLVDTYIEKLEGYTDKLSNIIEELGVRNVVPTQFIDAAKKLMNAQVERRAVIGDPGTPELNSLNTILGHTGDEDSIFSGGIEVKEPIMESEDLKKKLTEAKDKYPDAETYEYSSSEFEKNKSKIKEKFKKAGKTILDVIKTAGKVLLVVGIATGTPEAAVAYGTLKAIDNDY